MIVFIFGLTSARIVAKRVVAEISRVADAANFDGTRVFLFCFFIGFFRVEMFL